MINNSIKILIADDHPIFIQGLTSLISSFNQLNLVATAGNGLEVLKLLKENKVDVVITDVDMPIINGIQLTKEIKQTYPNIKVLALTMHNDKETISEMIKSGANAYISKDTNKIEFITAIETILTGGLYYGYGIKEKLEHTSTHTNQKNTQIAHIKMSERELEVLKSTAMGLTQQQIGEKLFISAHTVNFHRRNLFEKFEVKNTAELVKKAMDGGYL